MSFLTKLFGHLTSKFKDEDHNKIIQLLFVRVFCVVGIIFLAFLSTIDLLHAPHLSAFILIIPFLLLILILAKFCADIEKIKVAANIVILSFVLVDIYYIIRLPFGLSELLWFCSFPVLSFTLKGKKSGNRLSAIFLILFLGSMVFLMNFNENYASYTYLYFIKFTGIYLLVHALFYAFEDLKLIAENSFDSQLEDVKKDNRVKDEFISHLSHQIRTPLNNIMVIANLVNETELNDNQKDLMDTIIASTSTLVNVVNNIVKVTNVEFASSSSSSSTFDVIPTIRSSLNIISDHHKDKVDIDLKVNDLTNLSAYGDPLRLKQIFLNIIENIIDHSSNQKTAIDISLNLIKNKEEPSKIKLISNLTCDTILPFQEHDITENNLSYYKLPDSNDIIEEIPSCDFTIAKKILELNNGHLTIDSGAGYTSFSFIISFDKPQEKQGKKVTLSSETPPKSPKKINISDANLLLVEDNLINQKIVILSLKKLVKNIDVANNGKEALDKFGTSKYDLILMDIQMPVMNGIIATKKIRELEISSNSQTPIIAITANALAGDKETCLAAGMNDYISKPFQVDILVQKMKKLLEE